MNRPGPKLRVYPDNEISFVRSEYAAGKSVLEIATDLGRSRKYVQCIMKRADIATRVAVNLKQFGENNPNWKADGAGYDALHKRLYTRFGKPERCEVCDTTNAKRFDYANLTGRYEDLNDYAPMCVSCHAKYDGREANFLVARIQAKKQARAMR